MSLETWLKSGKYLPPPLRDFHHQKEVFKAMHELVGDSEATKRVDWITGHMYVIDVFLWFMARRGWTLQRSRHQQEFLDLDETVQAQRARREAMFAQALSGQNSYEENQNGVGK